MVLLCGLCELQVPTSAVLHSVIFNSITSVAVPCCRRLFVLKYCVFIWFALLPVSLFAQWSPWLYGKALWSNLARSFFLFVCGMRPPPLAFSVFLSVKEFLTLKKVQYGLTLYQVEGLDFSACATIHLPVAYLPAQWSLFFFSFFKFMVDGHPKREKREKTFFCCQRCNISSQFLRVASARSGLSAF